MNISALKYSIWPELLNKDKLFILKNGKWFLRREATVGNFLRYSKDLQRTIDIVMDDRHYSLRLCTVEEDTRITIGVHNHIVYINFGGSVGQDKPVNFYLVREDKHPIRLRHPIMWIHPGLRRHRNIKPQWFDALLSHLNKEYTIYRREHGN